MGAGDAERYRDPTSRTVQVITDQGAADVRSVRYVDNVLHAGRAVTDTAVGQVIGQDRLPAGKVGGRYAAVGDGQGPGVDVAEHDTAAGPANFTDGQVERSDRQYLCPGQRRSDVRAGYRCRIGDDCSASQPQADRRRKG